MGNYFIGIDVGTQGVRVVLMDEKGEQVTACEKAFDLTINSREEQSPLEWWNSCRSLMQMLTAEAGLLINLEEIRAIAVTSTSGTIIPIGHNHEPLHNAIMYSNPWSVQEASFCKEAALRNVKCGYRAFNASSGLPKMRWFLNRFPERASELHNFIHAADFIIGRLCGVYDVTDYTNALKSGFDLHDFEWPNYLSTEIGVEPEWLPAVRPSGTQLAELLPELAKEWGLPMHVIVTTGITDGCASQIASGAVCRGQWNTTLGTTMVIKGVSTKEVIDPTGAIYNHRHPSGLWMPGGASNTGADWVSCFFAQDDLNVLAEAAEQHLPSEHVAWPLLQQGERFPFFAPNARGFWPEGDKEEMFMACMEGVAFIEKYAYDRIESLSGEKIEQVLSAGGGSKNVTWLKIRSSVLNKPVAKAKNVSGAVGAAILAASKTYYASLEEAAKAMVRPESVIEPVQHWVAPYEEKYRVFIETLKAKHYLS